MWKYNKTENLPGDSLYHSADELYHYGVLGMRWRHKKAQWQQIRDAKKAYRQRNSHIQDKYFKSMENIEKGYKRGQMLSKKDQARELRADTLATNGWKKSKAQLKSDIAKAKTRFNKNVETSKRNKAEAKALLKEAKARYKSSEKSYLKEFDKISSERRFGKNAESKQIDRALNAGRKANADKKAYKKVKSDYNKLKKNW